MDEKDKELLKEWTNYRDPSAHFYNDIKMIAFAKWYNEKMKVTIKK